MKDIILEYIFLEMQSVFLLYCISASWNILSVVMQFQILLRSLCFLIMLEGWPEPCVQIPNGEQNINWTLLVWCSLLQGSPTGVCLSDLCLRPTSCIKTSGPRPRRMTDCCNPWPVFTLQSHVTTVTLFPLPHLYYNISQSVVYTEACDCRKVLAAILWGTVIRDCEMRFEEENLRLVSKHSPLNRNDPFWRKSLDCKWTTVLRPTSVTSEWFIKRKRRALAQILPPVFNLQLNVCNCTSILALSCRFTHSALVVRG